MNIQKTYTPPDYDGQSFNTWAKQVLSKKPSGFSDFANTEWHPKSEDEGNDDNSNELTNSLKM